MPPVPPPKIVRAVEAIRASLQKLVRKLAPAPFALLELAQGSMVTQAIYVAAELRVAEALVDGPLPVNVLASKVGAEPDALFRLLRALATYGIFTERRDGSFALTPMASALRADAPITMRDIAVLMGHPIHWEDWSHLIDTVRTGEPSLPKLRGMGAFEYLEANPEYGSVFIGGMGNMSETETDPIVAGYDFSRFGTVVDFGAGRGTLLAGILRKNPRLKGILVDPRVDSNGARDFLEEAGVLDRVEIEKSGLFDPVPTGGDAYVLKHIVHDWPEAKVVEMLTNIRAAMRPEGRLLLVEMVPPTGNKAHAGKLVDLWLMLLVGGKERTEHQYAEVLAKAGFRLERVVETAAPVSVVEARPV
jgi:hypothetical protein